jgi:ATP-dependent DNA helicase RecG
VSLEALPINLEDLLHRRSVEDNRIEFKAAWNDLDKAWTVRTACAFANDLLNLGGGYILLGVEAERGAPVFPVRGLLGQDLDRLQRDIRAACGWIQPPYQPLLFVAHRDDRPLLVIWAPGGDSRPYTAPEKLNKLSERHYYIRRGSETVEARREEQEALLELAAKVPFDDRRNNAGARAEDLSPPLVRRFLSDVRSDLARLEPPVEPAQLYRQMNLVVRVNAHEVPRNVALLFFTEDPEKFFRGARTEVVRFEASGDLTEERVFRGPVHSQIQEALSYLDSLGGRRLRKVQGQPEVESTIPYPYDALREAIVNALYHRGYDAPPEPVKLYLYPDRLEIISYPGPVAGIQHSHLVPGAALPPVPARNRRIGDLLKELRLAEGRGTGIPKIQRKMRENGSPEARFDFDDERTYFRVTLPVHPRHLIANALEQAGYFWHIGEKREALRTLESSLEGQPASGEITSKIIEYAVELDDDVAAERAFEKFRAARGQAAQPIFAMAGLLIDRGRTAEAVSLLREIPASRSVDDTLDAAILRKRAGDYEGAHKLFAEAFGLSPDQAKLLQNFAQTKVELARRIRVRSDADQAAKRKLNVEAADLLRRAIKLSTDPLRQAWCWYDLARALDWLGTPRGEVETAFQKALELLPGEPRFNEAYNTWKARNGRPRRRR